MTPAQLIPTAARRHTRFRRDAELDHPGALDSDYRGSGLSRGHLAPAEDFAWSDDALRSTYVLSNAVPQYQNPNSGRWAQLEAAVRRIASESDAVAVYSGPIFDHPESTETIGAGQVAVPTHTYKVILALQGGQMTAYAASIPNRPVALPPERQRLLESDRRPFTHTTHN